MKKLSIAIAAGHNLAIFKIHFSFFPYMIFFFFFFQKRLYDHQMLLDSNISFTSIDYVFCRSAPHYGMTLIVIKA